MGPENATVPFSVDSWCAPRFRWLPRRPSKDSTSCSRTDQVNPLSLCCNVTYHRQAEKCEERMHSKSLTLVYGPGNPKSPRLLLRVRRPWVHDEQHKSDTHCYWYCECFQGSQRLYEKTFHFCHNIFSFIPVKVITCTSSTPWSLVRSNNH